MKIFFYVALHSVRFPNLLGALLLGGKERRPGGTETRGRETEEERQRQRGRGRESAAHKFFEKLEVYRFRQDLSSKAILKPRAYDHAEQVKKLPPE